MTIPFSFFDLIFKIFSFFCEVILDVHHMSLFWRFSLKANAAYRQPHGANILLVSFMNEAHINLPEA